jgi:hypothetical protein
MVSSDFVRVPFSFNRLVSRLANQRWIDKEGRRQDNPTSVQESWSTRTVVCRESPRLHPYISQAGARTPTPDSHSQSDTSPSPPAQSGQCQVPAVAWAGPTLVAHIRRMTLPGRHCVGISSCSGRAGIGWATVLDGERSGSCIRRYGTVSARRCNRGSGCRSRQAPECSGFESLRGMVGNGPKRSGHAAPVRLSAASRQPAPTH